MDKRELKKIVKKSLLKLFSLLEIRPRRNNDAIVPLYHDVDSGGSDYSIRKEIFAGQIDYLVASNVNWMLATELVSSLANLKSHNTVCVTFDDGTASSYQAILNLLEKGGKCTQFIIPQRVDDNYKGIMDWGSIKELSSLGVEIGSHTLTHPYLSRISSEAMEKELRDSKSILEDKLGKPVTSLAYPYGDFNADVIEMVKVCGYKCAYTTQHIYASPLVDNYRIPRFETVNSVCEIEDLYLGRAHRFYTLLPRILKMRSAN